MALTVGVSGPLLEATGSPAGHVVSVILVSGWMYALIAFGTGLAARSKVGAALTAWGALVVTVTAYYTTKATQGDFRVPDYNDPSNTAEVFGWGEFLSMIAVWCVFATVLGPLCGLAGHLSRAAHGPRRPLLRLPFQLAIPVVVVVETTMRLTHEAGGAHASVVGPVWTVTRLLALAAALFLAAAAVLATRRPQSTTAS
ncbi:MULTISPECIES: hypothetical protein [Streptomyces]|uniref:hypothetical protein n=1 Tax=Streptomyces TaxID=1883 RepID=UPI00167A3AB3|nr:MULTISPECIES: hypothetical protein [Streptomyces]MBD3576199.1 hypothetical protein [Streptomyces sp. KD18]